MSNRWFKEFILLEIVIQSKLLAVYGFDAEIRDKRVCLVAVASADHRSGVVTINELRAPTFP